MLDIFKEGLKLNQALALLPLKALRSLMGEKDRNARQMVDMAEEMVSTPFLAAERALDNTCKGAAAKEAGPVCEAGGGPNIRNVWVNPGVEVFSDAEIGDRRRAVLKVTGLLCGG